jgi:hypothetical protein
MRTQLVAWPLVALALPCQARDLRVPADFADLQSAIAAAAPGDGVVVAPGEYLIDQPLSFLGKPLSVRASGGPQSTTIRMSATPRDPLRASVVLFENSEPPEAVLDGFTLTGGAGSVVQDYLPGGGGILFNSGGSPTIRRCDISGNSADWGAGLLLLNQSSPRLIDCVISGNNRSEGATSNDSSPLFLNCTITANAGYGLAAVRSSLTLRSSILWDNVAGSIYAEGPPYPVVSHSAIEDDHNFPEAYHLWPGDGNIAGDPLFCGWADRSEVWVDGARPGPGQGSAQSPYGSLGPALAYSLALAAGSPCRTTGEGGTDMGASRGLCDRPGTPARKIYLAAGRYAAKGLTLAHHASLNGKSMEATTVEDTLFGLRSLARLADLTVEGGALGGVVVGPEEEPEILRSAMKNNSGNGIECQAASPVLTDCAISGNSGFGLFCEEGSSLTVKSCVITDNAGGGVGCESSSPSITGSSIAGNHGYGISLDNSSPVITDSRVSGNSSGDLEAVDSRPDLTEVTILGEASSEYGWMRLNHCKVGSVYCTKGGASLSACTIGAVDCFDNGGADLTNCTLTGLSASDSSGATLNSCTVYGGPIHVDSQGSVTLTNSIVWGVTGSSLTVDRSSQATLEYSDLQGSPVWPGQGNINRDPLFVSSTDHHLRPGSPAIDSGTSEGVPSTDLDGNPRPCGSGVDMGAYERCSGGTGFRRGDTNGDSCQDMTDAITTLNFLFASGPPLSCQKSGDLNDDGKLDIADSIALLRYLFLGGAKPAEPFTACGSDPTPDALTCESSPGCS